MCKYNYSGYKCANMDIDAFFCLGEDNCSLSDIMRLRDFNNVPENGAWDTIPFKIPSVGKHRL